ncbi:hypothetical protein [Streptomyces sp. NBC_00203]|uniref:hypothetical protein n=1 Tax=Streptomyces sp. NBC_00203 TaxID=2975680 RepID=UPI0032436EFF
MTQYRLPSTTDVVPLLQFAPSKTDTDRLLLVSRALADILSAIINRLRAPDGAIPLVASYDVREKVWNPQRRCCSSATSAPSTAHSRRPPSENCPSTPWLPPA